MERDTALGYLGIIHDRLPGSGRLFSINRYEDTPNKGGIDYAMTGMKTLIQEVGCFSRIGEIALENSYSMLNDPLCPDSNIEIALYGKE